MAEKINVSCLSSLMEVTEADILTVVAMAVHVVVAGRVAVLESAVVVEVEMIETRLSQGHKWDFCRGAVFFEIPSPYPLLNPPLFHCP